MIDYIIAAIMAPILAAISILTMIVILIAFMFVINLCERQKPKEPKTKRTMDNPERFWDTEYFIGYVTLIGRLGGDIVIFSNDRSQYKLIPEEEFLARNPHAYDPNNERLTWGGNSISRDIEYLGKKVLP